LEGKGETSHKQMGEYGRSEYEHFDARRKKFEADQADVQDMEELRQLEQAIKQEHSK